MSDSKKLTSREAIEARFWIKVRSSIDGCWEWFRAKNRGGYGQFNVSGKKHLTHRFSWELHFGPIPEGMLVCHHCDNPCCVRPDHLFLGTATDNRRDAIQKGRGKFWGNGIEQRNNCGERSATAKLTKSQVQEIRELNKHGLGNRRLARRFSVSRQTIKDILRNITWRHLPCSEPDREASDEGS